MANLTPQLQDACAELDKAHRRIAELEAGHRLLQERLQQSETLWQSLMQHSPMGMLLCQLHQDGRLLVAEASRAASRLLGKDVSQLQGQPLEAALPGLQSAEFLEQLKAQASGGPSAPSGPFTCAAPHTTLTIRAFRPIPRHVAVLLHEQSESEERLRQAEQATLASETEMESVFRVAPVGIGIVDNRRFSKVNDRVCEMLGYTREEILAQPNSKFLFLSDEEFETFGEQRARQIQEHGVSSVEILSRRKNGEIFELLLSSTELVVDGKPPRVTFTALDITQRKEAEKALRKSEERYRKLVEQSPTLILTHQQGRITFVNRAGMAMLGISSPEEVLGHPTLNFIRPSRQAATREHLRAAGETKAPTAECDLMRADGSVLHVHGNSSSYEMEGQSSGLFIGIDVTEKVKAEDALAEIREEYRKIFNNSILGVFQSLPCGRFQLLNPAMARIFGYGSPEDMLADITDIPTQLYVDGEERKSFLGAINERGQVETVERHMKRKNGQEICVYINARAVNYDPESGRYDYIDGFMEDITQRKLAEEALQRAERKKPLF